MVVLILAPDLRTAFTMTTLWVWEDAAWPGPHPNSRLVTSLGGNNSLKDKSLLLGIGGWRVGVPQPCSYLSSFGTNELE